MSIPLVSLLLLLGWPGQTAGRDAGDVPRFCERLRVNDCLTECVISALAEGEADRLTLNQCRLTDVIRWGAQSGDFLAADPLDQVVRVQIFSPGVLRTPVSY